jgi:hypothetical protein
MVSVKSKHPSTREAVTSLWKCQRFREPQSLRGDEAKNVNRQKKLALHGRCPACKLSCMGLFTDFKSRLWGCLSFVSAETL